VCGVCVCGVWCVCVVCVCVCGVWCVVCVCVKRTITVPSLTLYEHVLLVSQT